MFERVQDLPVGIEEVELSVGPIENLVEVDGEFVIEEPEEVSSLEGVAFDANLADHLDEAVLHAIGHQLLMDIENDEMSRAEWNDIYKKGIDLLGMKEEERTLPWPGACGLYDTTIAEAVVRFQSQATMEIFPPSGPVKTNIIGRITDEREAQARRVQDDMNYELTQEMEDYFPETEKLLFSLPLCGSAFRKIHPDPITGKATARFIPAQDFIMPYGASSIAKAERYTELLHMPKNELLQLQATGFYRKVIVDESMGIPSELQGKMDETEGVSPPVMDLGFVELKECHCHLNIDVEGLRSEDGVAVPYIVTIDDRGSVLAIRRNWEESDPFKKKCIYYVQYDYIPGFGAYAFGLIHLLGGTGKTATSLMRMLLDSGTLANLPGGLKAKGLRMKGDDTPIRPGEWREAEVMGNKLADSFFPLPYKEPSVVLAGLLDKVVEKGQRLGSIADIEIGDVTANAPVGTTLALMERAMKVMSAVQKRLHASLGREFKLLAKIIAKTKPDEYAYDVDAPRSIKASDYDDRIDIIPVSDPNAATLSQRVTQYQAVIQMAQTAPQIYDLREVHRKMLQVLGIREVEKLIPRPDDIKPLDPVAENMALTTGKPVKAFEWQNHEAHMAVHQAFFEDPQIRQVLGQNPQAQAIASAIQAHIAEHLAYQYRVEVEIQLGSPLPPLDAPLPGDIESNLSIAVAEAAKRLTGKHQQEAQAAEIMAKQQDPVVQMQQEELKIKSAAVQQKQAEAQLEAQTDLQKAAEREKTERERIKSNERMAADAAVDKQTQFLAELKLQYAQEQREMKDLLFRVLEKLGEKENGDDQGQV